MSKRASTKRGRETTEPSSIGSAATKTVVVGPELTSALLDAVGGIMASTSAEASFVHLYNNAFDLVLGRQGENLYKGVVQIFSGTSSIIGRNALKEHDVVGGLVARYRHYSARANMIAGVLSYLDSTYVRQKALDTVYEAAMRCFFQEALLNNMRIARARALHRLDAHRMGESPDSALATVASFVKMVDALVTMLKPTQKESYIQTPLIQATETFYETQAAQRIISESAPAYAAWVKNRADFEKRLGDASLCGMGAKLKERVLERAFLRYADALVANAESGLLPMLKQKQIAHMRLLFDLLKESKAPLQGSILVFREFISTTGDDILKQEALPGSAELICFLENTLEVLQESFDGDDLFRRAMKESFESFINKDAQCAKNLALFIHEALCGKQVLDGDPLARSMGAFKFIHDKDVFKSMYQDHFCKRLLANKGTADSEKQMIQQLKIECGNRYTASLEGMLKDMDISRELTSEFANTPQFPSAPEFSALVLSSGSWPASLYFQEHAQIRLPPVLKTLQSQFESFYLGKHTGRKLSWSYAHGSCDVRPHGLDQPYEFETSLFQCMCLCLFTSTRQSITFGEFLEETGIPAEHLKRHLISLATPKYQILLKSGSPRQFKNEDAYSINYAFASPLRRKIKIPLVIFDRAAPTEASAGGQISEEVAEQRKHALDAAIIRVMKSQKRVDHQTLVAESSRHLGFVPTPQDVKKRIESLMEREYIERENEVYVYIQ
jgi:cullin 3